MNQEIDITQLDPECELAKPEPEPQAAPPPEAMIVEPLRDDAELLFLTGEAGTGKSTVVQHARKQRPGTYEVTATTGVAAMNANGITINSFLGYGTNQELGYLHSSGRLIWRLKEACERIQFLVLDEVSMMHASALDMLVDGIRRLNDEGREVLDFFTNEYIRMPLRLVVVGDFAQLPPVAPGATITPWAFNAQCWKDFEIQKLTKVHRQANPAFRDAIQAARIGNGAKCVRLLQECGVRFQPYLQDGMITLFSTNNEVTAWNMEKFTRLMGQGGHATAREFPTIRWGKQRTEWSKEIPDTITLCEGCRVRITANDTIGWRYVNGDQGVITDVAPNLIRVKLDRTGNVTELRRGRRFNDIESEKVRAIREAGETVLYREIYHADGSKMEIPYIGSVNYLPVKYGWASTVHSVQGLSLESLQVSPGHKFFASPNLAYVALSRARNPEGLVIHGTPEQLSKKIVVDKEALKWT